MTHPTVGDRGRTFCAKRFGPAEHIKSGVLLVSKKILALRVYSVFRTSAGAKKRRSDSRNECLRSHVSSDARY